MRSTRLFDVVGCSVFHTLLMFSLFLSHSLTTLPYILFRMDTTDVASHTSNICFTVSSAFPHCRHVVVVIALNPNRFWSYRNRALANLSRALLHAVVGVSICMYDGML